MISFGVERRGECNVPDGKAQRVSATTDKHQSSPTPVRSRLSDPNPGNGRECDEATIIHPEADMDANPARTWIFLGIACYNAIENQAAEGEKSRYDEVRQDVLRFSQSSIPSCQNAGDTVHGGSREPKCNQSPKE